MFRGVYETIINAIMVKSDYFFRLENIFTLKYIKNGHNS